MIPVKALAVSGLGKTGIVELSTPDIRPMEALVRVRAVALCTLEQRVFRGLVKAPLPFVGGHEVAGEIIALGEEARVSGFNPGDRVAVRLLYNCGVCAACRSGQSNLCDHARHKPVREGLLPGPGGLMDQVIVPANMLFGIQDSLSFEEASLTEPLACCVHSVNRARVGLGEDVVIIGGGIMGQFHVMLAKLRGARVMLSEPIEARRDMARTHGADLAIDPGEGDPADAVLEWTQGQGAGAVFNTTADAGAFAQAVQMAGKGGRVIQYSSLHPDVPTAVSPQRIHSQEVTITGSVSPVVEDFATANRLLNHGLINCRHLISGTFTCQEGQKAFEAAVQPGAMRVIITSA
ncbi:MAG: alcohol dehydrogenase catalytic domain-containing protein [Eubacteriales bacterium]|nr:alcohol dehydrogenase catalytic domain-containing protein [Eubacteriales bacterium]